MPKPHDPTILAGPKYHGNIHDVCRTKVPQAAHSHVYISNLLATTGNQDSTGDIMLKLRPNRKHSHSH